MLDGHALPDTQPDYTTLRRDEIIDRAAAIAQQVFEQQGWTYSAGTERYTPTQGEVRYVINRHVTAIEDGADISGSDKITAIRVGGTIEIKIDLGILPLARSNNR